MATDLNVLQFCTLTSSVLYGFLTRTTVFNDLSMGPFNDGIRTSILVTSFFVILAIFSGSEMLCITGLF